MYQHSNSSYPLVPPVAAPKRKSPKYAKKKVRIIKKIRAEKGVWKFISLDRIDGRYIWDNREGYYFIEWWEGEKTSA